MIGFVLVLAEYLRRPMGVAFADIRADVHHDRSCAGDRDHHLRISGERTAGVAAARAARLSEHVRKTRRRDVAGDRDSVRATGSAVAAADPVRRRNRSDLCRQNLSVLLHHHRLRRDLGLPRADFFRYHAEDDRAGMARLAGRLRLDGARKLRRDHGADRRVRAAAGRVLRREFAGGSGGGNAGSSGRDDQRMGLSGDRRRNAGACGGGRGEVVVLPHRRSAFACFRYGAYLCV